MNTMLRKQWRIKQRRNEESTGAIVDSQSITTADRGGVKGYDGGKKIKRRKRHILVDTQGVLLTVRIDGANEQDAESFLKMFEENPVNSLSMIWADSAYPRAYLKETLASLKIEP